MEVVEIDVDTLAGLLESGPVALLDVRMPDEFDEMRVSGGTLIPLPELPDRLHDVPAADPVYVICRSGARSAKACELLMANGRNAVNVAGGTLAWVESGRAVASGPEAG